MDDDFIYTEEYANPKDVERLLDLLSIKAEVTYLDNCEGQHIGCPTCMAYCLKHYAHPCTCTYGKAHAR